MPVCILHAGDELAYPDSDDDGPTTVCRSSTHGARPTSLAQGGRHVHLVGRGVRAEASPICSSHQARGSRVCPGNVQDRPGKDEEQDNSSQLLSDESTAPHDLDL